MNTPAPTAPATVTAAVHEDLVVEDLSQLAADEYRAGTCICWVDEGLAA